MGLQRKRIKIKFVGFVWEGFKPEELLIYRILCKYYDVVICDDADYIICTIFGEKYEYCKYPQVRIMYVGENYIPDYNFVDYSICRYPLTLYDRNFFLPGCADDMDGHWSALWDKERNFNRDFLASKEFFGNFIAGHESENNIRGDFFKLLETYKRIESPGRYLNNMVDKKVVNFRDSSKIEFQRKCKFTLCFESTSHYDFCTEKIVDAFYSDTIPVYYGNKEIDKIFNKDAFIDCSKYESFLQVKERIIELDQNDDLYLEMLNRPIFAEEFNPYKLEEDLEAYVRHIFDQPLESAYRRSQVYQPKEYERYVTNTTAKQPSKTLGTRIKAKMIRVKNAIGI